MANHWDGESTSPDTQRAHVRGVIRRGLIALGIAWLSVFQAAAQPQELMLGPGNVYSIPLNKSGVVRTSQRVKQVSVGRSEVADIIILDDNQIYIVGRSLGTTNVLLWNRQGKVFDTIDVEVTHDLDSLKRKLHEVMPGEPVAVRSVQGKLVMSGTLSSMAKMNAAIDLASSFVPDCSPSGSAGGAGAAGPSLAGASPSLGGGGPAGQSEDEGCSGIINMMEIGGVQQVMLEIKVAEMNRSVLKRLESNVNILNFGNHTRFGAVNGGATFPNGRFPVLDADGSVTDREIDLLGNLRSSPVGPPVQIFQPNTPTIQDKGLFLSYLAGDTFLQAVLEASRENGLAKILAEPVLTTITGQEAQFISGGEFPIPVAQQAGQVTIEFKEFGVGVKFLPTVLDTGRISMKLNINVSELSSDVPVVLGLSGTASTFAIPSLTKRGAGSAVELNDGQTIGIAGLISDNLRENVGKLPGLGDVPMLGMLFRSQEFLSGQTELVMFVTPHLAKPISKKDIRLPTDQFVPPDDKEFFFDGRVNSRRPPPLPPAPAQTGKADSSSFGHDL